MASAFFIDIAAKALRATKQVNFILLLTPPKARPSFIIIAATLAMNGTIYANAILVAKLPVPQPIKL
ncbi:hypothetical protein PKOR_05365 [Pontibacter korlensis]|uniref:Uncharacterized protein n=1 Tax=Pontibacter korlensis TaxID=400092 RepID=A0A0E3UVN2_9BACT|nr:hypothetical protein PKOR_05365 [Pontibacter korlensis]